MLLVLNFLYYGRIACQVARTLHKSKGWASQLLKRYKEEELEELNDRQKAGRHPKISRQV
jgi:transposase